MIRAVFRREAGAIVEFTVSGHAGYDDPGRDVVCAAVSAVTQATLIGLQEVLGLKAEVNEARGHVACRLPAHIDPARREGAALLVNTLLRSLRSIEAGHRDYVDVQEVHR